MSLSTESSLPLASFNCLGSIILVDIYSFGRLKPELIGMDAAFCGPLNTTSHLLVLSWLHVA